MERGYHAIAGLVTSLVGLIVIITVTHNAGRYVALCVLLAGSYITPSLTMAWLSGNTPGKLKISAQSLRSGGLSPDCVFSTRKTSTSYRSEWIRQSSGRDWRAALPLKVWPDIPRSSLRNTRLYCIFFAWLHRISLRTSCCQPLSCP